MRVQTVDTCETPTGSGRHFYAHPHALVESDNIGVNTRIWAFAHVMAGARIGSDCNICDHVFIESGAILGNNVTVKNGVAIWDGVRIADDVFLGPHCVFTNDPNPRAYIKKASAALQSTIVGPNVTIGANATILCGITLGRYAFVGAGAVVIRSVSNFALVVGNPARQIGWMCLCAHKLEVPFAVFEQPPLVCKHCKASFSRTPGGLNLRDPKE